MIQYPKELPSPLREGYGFTPVSPLLRTKTQTGRAIQRRKYSSVPTEAAVSWVFNSSEAQLFESWFEEVLISGSKWFECELRTPQGLMPYRARFIDIYSGPKLFGVDHWRFTADFELFERPILLGGWAVYAPEFIAGMNIFDIAMNFDWPEFQEHQQPLLTESGQQLLTEAGEVILV
ncbi:hypothetical protein F2A38_15755 [Pseudomonas chlororaphis]|uniref:Transposase n=1 Tax=Pseudomonas chlororaphis TaxID=587753 RepID=A0AB34C5Q6_9PSED|nr:hypothetical protein [Pseudomonas chlororaphis]KAA5841986.1 hypothetical protein F2A38_15755 [Pseudomonas chlororaphis]